MSAINWRLVFRYVLPAVYIPAAALIGFGILVALTGANRYRHIDRVGVFVAGSSLVLVFARLATRELSAAAPNVLALAGGCLLFVTVVGALRGGWRDPQFWLGVCVLAALLATAAFVAVRWARRWARWRHGSGRP